MMNPQLEPYFAQVEAAKQSVAAAEAQVAELKAQLQLQVAALLDAVKTVYGAQ